eukprot:332174_1
MATVKTSKTKPKREREPLWKHTTKNDLDNTRSNVCCKYCGIALSHQIETVRNHFKNVGCNEIDAKNERLVTLILLKTAMEEYAKKNAKNTMTIKYGRDKNKKNQAGDAITVGKNTYVARQCSAHIRTVYSQSILQDDIKDEFCVNGRDDEYKNNECKLCGIENDEKWEQETSINIAEAIGGKLSDMIYNFSSNYPNNKNYTILRVKKNGVVIIEYYIKLIPYTQLIKTAAPSGYKYKDRSSLSKFIKIQSNSHQDVIFCISGNEVHCVGVWNLLKDGGIRKLIQIHQEKWFDASFYVLRDTNSTDIDSIDVELIVNRHDMKDEVKSLWHWSRNSHMENKNDYRASRASVSSVANSRDNPLGYRPVQPQFAYTIPSVNTPQMPPPLPQYTPSPQQFYVTQQIQHNRYNHTTQMSNGTPMSIFMTHQQMYIPPTQHTQYHTNQISNGTQQQHTPPQMYRQQQPMQHNQYYSNQIPNEIQEMNFFPSVSPSPMIVTAQTPMFMNPSMFPYFNTSLSTDCTFSLDMN